MVIFVNEEYNEIFSILEIQIPPYDTKEELKQKLLLAIFEGQEGFMLT